MLREMSALFFAVDTGEWKANSRDRILVPSRAPEYEAMSSPTAGEE